MDPIEIADIVRSLRRSRGRVAVLQALVALDAATAAELAVVAGLHRRHVAGALRGRMPDFVPARSLLAFGLVTPRMTRHGVVFEATAKARAVAGLLPGRAAPRVHLNIAPTRSL